MVTESIREFNRAVPFMPYEIHTLRGETYEIPHPDSFSFHPRGSYIVVIDPKDPNDGPQHISSLFIERASLLNNHKRRKERKRS